MIDLIPISPSRPAADVVHVPLVKPHQLPHGVPLDERPKQLMEPA